MSDIDTTEETFGMIAHMTDVELSAYAEDNGCPSVRENLAAGQSQEQATAYLVGADPYFDDDEGRYLQAYVQHLHTGAYLPEYAILRRTRGVIDPEHLCSIAGSTATAKVLGEFVKAGSLPAYRERIAALEISGQIVLPRSVCRAGKVGMHETIIVQREA